MEPSQRASNECFELRSGDLIIEARRDEAELRLCDGELRRELIQLRGDARLIALALHAQILLGCLHRFAREPNVLFGEPKTAQEPRSLGARLTRSIERSHPRDLGSGIGALNGVLPL